VEEQQAAFPIASPPHAAAFDAAPGPLVSRWSAMLQVLIICGIPTQIVAATVLALGLGIPPMIAGTISFEFVAILSFVDTALVAVLIRVFLTLSGERSGDVFVGTRPVAGEMLRGLAWLPVVFIGVAGLVLGIRAIAPWMHNVETSPFEAFVSTPTQAAIFLVVVVLAGGVREELQRAFILHRFEQRLGGVKLGLALFSIAFGAFHVDQGYDVALAICFLGLFWGTAYIKRRSSIMPMVNHASFNAAQVAQIVLARTFNA
jgi:membrane protease YdiL (CAAX protease family)